MLFLLEKLYKRQYETIFDLSVREWCHTLEVTYEMRNLCILTNHQHRDSENFLRIGEHEILGKR